MGERGTWCFLRLPCSAGARQAHFVLRLIPGGRSPAVSRSLTEPSGPSSVQWPYQAAKRRAGSKAPFTRACGAQSSCAIRPARPAPALTQVGGPRERCFPLRRDSESSCQGRCCDPRGALQERGKRECFYLCFLLICCFLYSCQSLPSWERKSSFGEFKAFIRVQTVALSPRCSRMFRRLQV